MKKVILSVLVLTMIVGTILVSCQKEEVRKELNDNSVVNSYNDNLPDNVDSILVVTKSNSFFTEAVNSEEFKASGILEISNTIGIYYYSNGYVAVLISDKDEKNVFSYIVNSNTKEKVETLNANFKFDSKNTLKKVSIVSSSSLHDWDSEVKANGGWGDCMDNAIDELYDDWSNDPVGTSTCWLTGPLCGIGGGIACAIQTW
jgi:hypothetical protein